MDIEVNLPNENIDNAGCVNNKPRVGMRFSSENEAYEFYNNYGGTTGFSIKRDCVHWDKDDKTIIRSRRFLCNKSGTRGVDKRDTHTKKPRAETRTGCLARMCISRLPNGEYECRDFADEHNHELHTLATRHFMRSQRSISDRQEFEIDIADDSGIRPKATFDYMGIQAGGTENLGCTRVDLKNYLQTKRQRSLAKGEVGVLSTYFAKQIRLNPSFTYCLQYDNEDMVTNIFWADPRMLIDYSLFGDVVIFDTTFCTNKESRPLGVFAGFNHHRCATIFGAALLYDETAASFMWLFETFLEAHGQKKPKTIFTDHDATMSKAIAEVLPETWHGLCTWRILQNGIKHLGNLMKGESSFLKDFKKCIYEYEEELEFEEAWQQLCNDNRIENNSWLDQIYGIKEKWARCYMKHTFTLGVRNTQLVESINRDLKDYLRPSLDLVQFFKHFEQVVEDKRTNELKADFDARNTLPRFMGFKSPILRQAGKVYTPYMYEKFLEEYQWVASCSLKSLNETEQGCQYVVGVIDEEGEMMAKDFTVGYKQDGPLIACSCRYFETVGILCRHVLKILDVLDMKSIPETYILSRWTRAARSMIVENKLGVQVSEDVQLDCTERFRYICPIFVRLSTQASTSTEGFEFAKKAAETLSRQLASVVIDGPSTGASVQCIPENILENTGLVLKRKEKHKGSSKKRKGWVEGMNGKRKGNKATQSEPSTEVSRPQQHSQGMVMGNALQGSQDTVNRTGFNALLMGIQSSQAPSDTTSIHSHISEFGLHSFPFAFF